MISGPQTPKHVLAEMADLGRRVAAAIARQSSDCTRVRFFGEEVIVAARQQAVDAKYMSDEDTVVVLYEYGNGTKAYGSTHPMFEPLLVQDRFISILVTKSV